MTALARVSPPAGPQDPEVLRSGSMVPLARRLKLCAQPYHNALHRQAALRLLFRPRLAPPAYRFILDRFDAFLEAAESQVLISGDPWLAANGFARVSRRQDLRQDLDALTALGVPPTDETRPEPPDLGVPPGPGAVLGLLYVIEGSRLGGGYLARRVAGMLPTHVRGATSFLGSPGLDVGENWRQVCATIDLLGEDPAMEEPACDAAQAAFVHLAALFSEVP